MKLNSAQMRYFGAMVLEENAECLRLALLEKESPHKETLQNLFRSFRVEFTQAVESKFLARLQEVEQNEILHNLLQRIQQEIHVGSQVLKEGKSSVQELVHFLEQ